MIWPFVSLLMFIVFVPSNGTPHVSMSEFPITVDRSELEPDPVEQQLVEDCRYLADHIPHRDLSDYVVIADSQSAENDVLEVENSETEELSDPDRVERHAGAPESDYSDSEDQE